MSEGLHTENKTTLKNILLGFGHQRDNLHNFDYFHVELNKYVLCMLDDCNNILSIYI